MQQSNERTESQIPTLALQKQLSKKDIKITLQTSTQETQIIHPAYQNISGDCKTKILDIKLPGKLLVKLNHSTQ